MWRILLGQTEENLLMAGSELNENMAEGLVGKAENVGNAEKSSWATVWMVVCEFIRFLRGK